MDKNTITGFILIALVVIGFSWYSQPSREELEAMAQRDSIAAVEQQKQAEAEQDRVTHAGPNGSTDVGGNGDILNQHRVDSHAHNDQKCLEA